MDEIEELHLLLQLAREALDKYNARRKQVFPDYTRQFIMEEHVFGCRCATCWYKFGGAKFAEDHPGVKVNTIYDDIEDSKIK